MFFIEMVYDVCVIYIGVEYFDLLLLLWFGYLVGYWDGDMLVVDMVGFYLFL